MATIIQRIYELLLEPIMTYYEIHRLSREGHSIARIAKYTKMDWRTIKKYLPMTEQEYEVFIDHAAKRKRKCIY